MPSLPKGFLGDLLAGHADTEIMVVNRAVTISAVARQADDAANPCHGRPAAIGYPA